MYVIVILQRIASICFSISWVCRTIAKHFKKHPEHDEAISKFASRFCKKKAARGVISDGGINQSRTGLVTLCLLSSNQPLLPESPLGLSMFGSSKAQLPHFRLGRPGCRGTIRIAETDLQQFLDSLKQETKPQENPAAPSRS